MTTTRIPWNRRGLHVLVKPVGAACNLRCRYCFYLEKASLYPSDATPGRMTDETLDAFVGQYLDAQPEGVDQVDFAFQGGEPTLAGLDFFRRVIELQARHARPGVRVSNSLQTNGILLDDAWCRFLKKHEFLVGLSLDGPPELHDAYRVDPSGKGSSAQVLEALRRLQRHKVEFNVLTCVHHGNADQPQAVYRFLRDRGVRFIQFIPIVERDAASPSGVGSRSVRPDQFGRFLIGAFDEWFARDVGRVFVRDFDHALAAWVGADASLCVYAPECGRAVALERNGDLYACDHFVDAEHRLGNLHDRPIVEWVNSPQQERFGRDKSNLLPQPCRECPVLFACQGGCPKDRFLPPARPAIPSGAMGLAPPGAMGGLSALAEEPKGVTTLHKGGQAAHGTRSFTTRGAPAAAPSDQGGLNYLCQGFRMFFDHIDVPMRAMAAEVRAGRPAAGAMRRSAAASADRSSESSSRPEMPRRNAPCPCGSGKKFKHCCMRQP